MSKQFHKRFPKKEKKKEEKKKKKKKYASYNTTVRSVRARRIEIRVVCRPLENFVLFLSFSLRVSEHERVARKWERVRGKVPSPSSLSFLFSFFFFPPFLLSLSTSQVEIGRASKAPNNTQSRSRLLSRSRHSIFRQNGTRSWLCVIVPPALPILYPSSVAQFACGLFCRAGKMDGKKKKEKRKKEKKKKTKKLAQSTTATATRISPTDFKAARDRPESSTSRKSFYLYYLLILFLFFIFCFFFFISPPFISFIYPIFVGTVTLSSLWTGS